MLTDSTDIHVGRRTPQGHVPRGGPAFSVAWPDGVDALLFGVLGVHAEQDGGLAADQVVRVVERTQRHAPVLVERARHRRVDGTVDEVLLCYWVDRDAAEGWWRDVDQWWADTAPDGVGIWVQLTETPLSRHETSYSNPHATIGLAAVGKLYPTDVHDYSGAALDRMPEDPLDPDRLPLWEHRDQVDGAVRSLPGRARCVIRTEQDWSAAPPQQAEAYLTQVQPTLDAAVRRLQEPSAARELRCVAAMPLQLVDLDTGAAMARTAVIAWFEDAEALEKWAASEPTHLAILGAFFTALAGPFGAELAITLWHEVGLPAQLLTATRGAGHPYLPVALDEDRPAV